MKITLITATFNSEKSIKDCLQSVVKQTYKNIEHIIIDGGSQDKTLEFIKAAPSVTKYISEPDKGIYDALNKGIALATGDIIGFIHSDDLFASKHVISQVVEIFHTNQVDGVYGNLRYVDKLNTDKIIRVWKSCAFQSKLLKQGWMPAHPTLFLRKSVYNKHGKFDLSYKISADYDFMIRVLKDPSLNFEYLPKVITKMRVGGASNRSIKNIIQKSKEDLEIMKKHKVGGITTLLGKNLSKIRQFF